MNFIPKGKKKPNDKSMDLEKSFFNVVEPITKHGIDGFLRGAILTRAQEVDTQVVDGLRNGLFSKSKTRNVHVTRNFDLISLNLQRGRDHALPNYNTLRNRFFKGKAKCFEQISTDSRVVNKLKKVYKNANSVEAFVGLMAEDHVPGSSFGPTLFNLWNEEFSRLRDGDRFYFRNENTMDQVIRNHPRVRQVLDDPKFEVFRQLILDHTKISTSELPKKMFLIDGISCGKFNGVPPKLLSSCP